MGLQLDEEGNIIETIPAHLHKKHGLFYFVVHIKGKYRWIPLKTKDEGIALDRWVEAEKHYRGLQNKFDVDAAFIEDKHLSFKQLVDRFISEVVIHNAVKTQETYKRMCIMELCQVLGDQGLTEISRQEIIRYHDSLRGQTMRSKQAGRFNGTTASEGTGLGICHGQHS